MEQDGKFEDVDVDQILKRLQGALTFEIPHTRFEFIDDRDKFTSWLQMDLTSVLAEMHAAPKTDMRGNDSYEWRYEASTGSFQLTHHGKPIVLYESSREESTPKP